MFGFFRSSKYKEVANKVQWLLANEFYNKGENVSSNDPSLAKIAREITSSWLEILPKNVINDCEPSILAAYVLVAESQVYAKKQGLKETAELYIEAAKFATKGMGFRAVAGQVTDAEFRLLISMAELAQKSGLSFYEELLEVKGQMR